jgi:hypothetical protein
MVMINNFKCQHIISEPDLTDREAEQRLFFYRHVPNDRRLPGRMS